MCATDIRLASADAWFSIKEARFWMRGGGAGNVEPGVRVIGLGTTMIGERLAAASRPSLLLRLFARIRVRVRVIAPK